MAVGWKYLYSSSVGLHNVALILIRRYLFWFYFLRSERNIESKNLPDKVTNLGIFTIWLASSGCLPHRSSIWPWSGAPKVRLYSTFMSGLRQVCPDRVLPPSLLHLPLTSLVVAHWRRTRGYFYWSWPLFSLKRMLPNCVYNQAYQGLWRGHGTPSSWPIPVLGAQGAMTSIPMKWCTSCMSLGILFLRWWFAACNDGRGTLCLTGWPGTSPAMGLLASIYCCLFLSSLFGLIWPIMSTLRLLPTTRPTSSRYSTRWTSVALFVDFATHPRSHQLLPTKHSRSGICFVGDCSGISPSQWGFTGRQEEVSLTLKSLGCIWMWQTKKKESSHCGLKNHKPGNYDRGMFKLTIILALEAGDPAVANGLVGLLTMPRVWVRISDEAGTTTEAYVNFICHVMDTYDAVANPTLRRTIIHNNLTLHKLPEVYKAVRLQSHRVICCPPY